MQFIKGKGMPKIPLEILEAREAGRLIMFCGAGVSARAGLPTFRKLVDSVYIKLN